MASGDIVVIKNVITSCYSESNQEAKIKPIFPILRILKLGESITKGRKSYENEDISSDISFIADAILKAIDPNM